MAPVEALPKALQSKWFEKQELPDSKSPPIFFVPRDKQYTGKGGNKPEKAKIDASTDVRKEYPVLKDPNYEDVLLLIDRHKTLVKSRQYVQRLKDNLQLLNKKTTEYNKLKAKKNGDHRIALEELSSAIAELKVERTDLHRGPFEVFGELIDEPTKVKWEETVTEITSGPHVDLDGVRQTAGRKMDMACLKDCYTHFLGHYGPPNSAERVDEAFSSNLTLDFVHCRPGAAVNRIQRVSGWLGIMPCLKNVEGAPAHLERMKPYSDYRLCQIVKNALIRPLRASYDAIANTEFECDPKKLIKDLEKAWEDSKSKKIEMKSLIRSTLAQELGDEYRIPRKNQRNGKETGKNNKAGGGGAAGDRNKSSARTSTKRECDRCKKFRPAGSKAYQTHNTADCKAFNADGTRKEGFTIYRREEGEVSNNYRKRYQNRISKAEKQSEIYEAERAAKKYKKKYEKLQRKYANRREERGRRRRRRQDDSSASSASLSSMSY